MEKGFSEDKVVGADLPEKMVEREPLGPEIEDLRRPMESLLRQLRERIEIGGYDFVVGEDASGRIPALILGKVLEILQKERGGNPLKIKFFAGRATERVLEEEISSWETNSGVGEKHEPPTALVVTDTIRTGKSIKPICSGLDKNGFEFDVATAGFEGYRKEFESVQKAIGRNIFCGRVGSTPQIYGKHKLAGIVKSGGEPHSKAYKTYKHDKLSELVQEKINRARKDAKQLADELVRYYHELEEERQKQKAQAA